MADREMVAKQLEIAGYHGIEFERIDAPLMVGDSPEAAGARENRSATLEAAAKLARLAGPRARGRRVGATGMNVLLGCTV